MPYSHRAAGLPGCSLNAHTAHTQIETFIFHEPNEVWEWFVPINAMHAAQRTLERWTMNDQRANMVFIQFSNNIVRLMYPLHAIAWQWSNALLATIMNEAPIQPTVRRVSCLGTRAPFTMAELLYIFPHRNVFNYSCIYSLHLHLSLSFPSLSLCLALRLCCQYFDIELACLVHAHSSCGSLEANVWMNRSWLCRLLSKFQATIGCERPGKGEREKRSARVIAEHRYLFYCGDKCGGTGSVSCANGFDVPHIQFVRHLIDDIASAAADTVFVHCCAFGFCVFVNYNLYTIGPPSPPLLPLLLFIFQLRVCIFDMTHFARYNEKWKRI